MKRTILFLLVLLAVCNPLQAAFQNPASNILSRAAYSASQSAYLNPVYLWANEAEGLIGGGVLGTGKAFYVDSGATGSAVGTSWTNAALTIDAAIGFCTASRGDIIYVAQGHSDAIASATGLVCDVAGVSIIGVGNGSLMPTISLGTATTATISVTAANVRISNIKVISAFANVAEAINLVGAGASGAVIDNCIICDGGTAILELNVGISVDADADNIRIINNQFYTFPGGAGLNAILLAGGSDNSVIAGNTIYGTYTTGGVLASAAASVNLTVTDNVIGAIDAIAWDNHASTTGLFARNLLGANTTSIAAALTGVEAMFCFENYVTGALGASGIIYPAVDSD